MSSILFVVPPSKNIFEQPPTGTLLLASILKENGLSSEVFPLPEFSKTDVFNSYIDNTVDSIASKKPKIISFYTRCDVYHIMLKIAEILKNTYKITIVFGGPQSDIVALETVKAFPYVDYVCQGEGETTVVPFFKSLLEGTPDLSVNGLVYKQGGNIIQNPRPTLVPNLDFLPEIDYSLIGMDRSNTAKLLPIDVGRGCPFGCSYCSTSSFWGRKFRLKSPERIRSEVISLHNTYGVTKFSFMHDMFTFNRKMITSICQELKQLDFPVTWSCSARIDCIDDELIDIMIDAGMRNTYFGIETGSPRLQKLVHKNLNLDLVLPRLKYIQSKGLRTTASFIYGFPDETLEDLSQTLFLIGEIAKLDLVSIQTHLCTFLPGTELSSLYANEMSPASFFSDISGSAGVKECHDLITKHPEVFPQFLEYETELRKKLEHFSLFVNVWVTMQPVYQFIAEKYNKNHLIDMYFDFSEVNRTSLDECKNLTEAEKLHYILEHDNLPNNRIPEELKAVVAECYRMAAVQTSPNLKEEDETIEIFSFSPKDFRRGTDITAYTQHPSLVKYKKQKNGKVQMFIGEL